jgi:hypothetical protein
MQHYFQFVTSSFFEITTQGNGDIIVQQNIFPPKSATNTTTEIE